MGQYRIRKAGPGEIPGYYSREQLELKRFAGGGIQEQDNSPNLSQMLPQITQMMASTILQDSDPENVDIRPLMSKIAGQLQQSGIDRDSIQPLVSAAGKQALELVADYLDNNKIKKEPSDAPVTEVGEELPQEEETPNYGYYDQSVGTQAGDDDAEMDSLLYDNNAALQNQPQAAMGMEVDNLQPYFSSSIDTEDLDNDYAGYEAFVNQMKYGGYQGKRKFMKETMNYLNKASQGMQQQGNTASLRGTSNDIQGKTLTSKDTFVPAVKQVAQNEVNKKFAEEQYNKMMSQQFQRGGESRRIRRANQALFGMPHALPGANTNYEFGPLGGLRSASVQFDPRMLQGFMGMPAMMPGMMPAQSSGWYSPSYQIKGTRTKSSVDAPAAQEAKAVNAANIPGATAPAGTTQPTDGSVTATTNPNAGTAVGGAGTGVAPVITNIGTVAPGTVVPGKTNTGTAPVVPPNKKDKVIPPVVEEEKVVTPQEKAEKPKITKGTDVIIPGKNFTYYKSSDGKWHYKTKDGKHGFVTNESTLKTLKDGKFKVKQPNIVYIYGDENHYFKGGDGKWHYFNENSEKHGYVTNEAKLKKLKAGKFAIDSKYSQDKNSELSLMKMDRRDPNESDAHYKARIKQYYDLPWYEKLVTENPQFEWEHDNTVTGLNPGNEKDYVARYVLPFVGMPGAGGAGAVDDLANFRFKQPNQLGPGQNVLNPGQQMLNPGQQMLNPGQGLLNPPGGYQFSLPFEEGGAVNPALYKYVYGGDDFSQNDLDFTQSKDVSDAYFRDGGLYHFDGTEDSQVDQNTNAQTPPPGLTKEDVQKMFDEYGQKMQTQYGQQQYGQNPSGGFQPGQILYSGNNGTVYDPNLNTNNMGAGSFGSAGVGQPMWGRPAYAPGYRMNGMLGQFGNMFSPYTRDFKYYTPYGGGKQGNPAINPMAIMAGSMANIQKSGMVPTKFSYSKEKKQDGNFFERKLGFNKDKVWTIDYAKPGASPISGTPNANANVTPNYGPNKDQNRPTVAGPYNDPKGHWGPVAMGTDLHPQDKMGQGLAPGAGPMNSSGNVMGAQDYMQSQLSVPGMQANPNGMPAGFPINNVGPMNTEMAYGGYIPLPLAFAYGGNVPYYAIAGEVNNQANPSSNTVPDWVTKPVDPMTTPPSMQCTEEQKQDPNSPCYEKQTEQLKFKEEQAGTINYDNIKNSLAVGARAYADTANQLQGIKNNYVPGMQKMIYDRMPAQQRKYTGKWEENSGQQNIMGFEGVVKKGGTTGLRENGEYQLTMDEIRQILKAGGKIEFL
jgi:hypothetical protein